MGGEVSGSRCQPLSIDSKARRVVGSFVLQCEWKIHLNWKSSPGGFDLQTSCKSVLCYSL